MKIKIYSEHKFLSIQLMFMKLLVLLLAHEKVNILYPSPSDCGCLHLRYTLHDSNNLSCEAILTHTRHFAYKKCEHTQNVETWITKNVIFLLFCLINKF